MQRNLDRKNNLMKKNISVLIRKAQKFDLKGLLGLWDNSGLAISDKKSEEEELLRMVSLNPSSCFVAEYGEEIIGSVLGVFAGRRAWIYHLAIDPKFQKQGIGTKLLKSAEQALVKVGGHKLRLFVEFTNLKVIPFYEKNGYAVINDAILLGKNVIPGRIRRGN